MFDTEKTKHYLRSSSGDMLAQIKLCDKGYILNCCYYNKKDFCYVKMPQLV